MRALRLSLLLCLGLTGPALAQDNAEPQDPAIQAPDRGDYDKISELLDSIQTRVDETNANAKNTNAAMAFLSDQVEAAIRKLLSRETENSTLRNAALGLSAELKSVAATRDELGFKVVRLTQEKDEIFERLEGQVRELASLLSMEHEVSASLRKSLEDRSAGLRASLDERDRIAVDLGDIREALAEQQATSEARLRRIAALERDGAELRDERAVLESTRDELGFKVVRLTQEKDEIFEQLEGQVRELASLLSMEHEVSASLRKSLEDRSAGLRASLDERDRIAVDLGDIREALAEQQATSEARLRRIAALERDGAELRDERAVLESRLVAETAPLETTQALLVDTRTRNAALDGELIATNARMAELNRQLAALRQQISELRGLLANSEGENRAQQDVIANLGRRLNLALATRVRELARYRSEFFGRLRDVLGERSDVRIVGDRFVFQSEVLFRTGEAELEEPGRAQLRTLANSLKEVGRTIPTDIDWVLRIDGHTDERPIQTSRFPSNWELSTTRAISVVKFLIEQGVPAERVMATGFAHFRPLDPRRDEIAFRRNRRIEFRLTQK